jgi:hypothetical protein
MSNSTSAQEGPRPDQLILQIGTGYILSAALQVAVKLGIAEQLAPGPRPVADLARMVGANEDALFRRCARWQASVSSRKADREHLR